MNDKEKSTIDSKTIEHLAKLARIHIEDKDLDRCTEDIINVINVLGAIDSISPSVIADSTDQIMAPLREDIVKDDDFCCSNLEHFKQECTDTDLFFVPQTIEDIKDEG